MSTNLPGALPIERRTRGDTANLAFVTGLLTKLNHRSGASRSYLVSVFVGLLVGGIAAFLGRHVSAGALFSHLLGGAAAGPATVWAYHGTLSLLPRLHARRLSRARTARLQETADDGRGRLEESPDRLPESDATRWGTALLLLGEAEPAVRAFEQGRQGAGSPALYNNLGVALSLCGRAEEAREAFSTAANLATKHTEIELNIAHLRVRTRHYDSARKHLFKAVRDGDVALRWRHALGCLDYLEGEPARALEVFSALVASHTGPSPELLADLAVALATDGRHDDALQALAAALRQRPGWAEALANRGLVQLHAGSARRAVSDLKRARRREPNQGLIAINLGVAEWQRGRCEAAKQSFRDALRSAGAQFEAHANLAEAALREERWEDAVADLQQALSRRPADPDTLANHGAALFHLGRLDAAEAVLKKVASGRYGRPALIRHNLGLIYAVTGRLGPATTVLKSACEIEPDVIGHWRALAYAYHVGGMVDEAFAAHRQVFRREHSAETLYHLGLCEYGLGRTRHAIQRLEEALQVDPKLHQAWFPLGCGHADVGQTADALRCWERGIEHEPESPELLSNLGEAYYKTDRIERAVECFRRAYLARPDNPSFCNNLALAYAKSDRHDRAADFFQRAVELDPASAVMRCNLGLAYYLSGQIDEALTEWTQVSQVDPTYYLRRRGDLHSTFDDMELNALPLNWAQRALPLKAMTAGFRFSYLFHTPKLPWQILLTRDLDLPEETPERWSDESFDVHWS